MRFDLQAQIYINCGFSKINYLILNIEVHFYKESNELKSLVLCSTADFYSENKTKRGKYIVNIYLKPKGQNYILRTLSFISICE